MDDGASEQAGEIKGGTNWHREGVDDNCRACLRSSDIRDRVDRPRVQRFSRDPAVELSTGIATTEATADTRTRARVVRARENMRESAGGLCERRANKVAGLTEIPSSKLRRISCASGADAAPGRMPSPSQPQREQSYKSIDQPVTGETPLGLRAHGANGATGRLRRRR